MLERAKNSSAGWRREELVNLYKLFGFEIRTGGYDLNAIHPVYKDLRGSISNSSGELANGYVRHAVKMIERLFEYQGEENE